MKPLREMSWEELRETYNPDGSVLRRAQLRMVEMLQFLDRFCKEHGICYWLDSGNLLGAARNGQFIPWDDDMDVCMPYEDAVKFKKLMLTSNPSDEFVLQCRETDEGYFGSWIVLRDLRSEYVQDTNTHRLRKFRGLQIDIFIYEERAIPFLFKCAFVWQRHFINRPLESGKGRFLVKPCWYLLYRFFVPIFRALSPRRDILVSTYGTGYAKGFPPYRREDVLPLSEITFEGCKVPAPKDVDAYLSALYGDWRQLPESATTHEVEIIFK